MIDLLALFVPHFVMAIAVWRLVSRTDLDDDPALPRTSARHNPETPRKPARQPAHHDTDGAQ